MQIFTLPMNRNKPCEGEDDQTTDLIIYDSNGELLSWSVYSYTANHWVNIDLIDLHKKWPARIEFVQNEINHRVQDMRKNQVVDEYVKSQKEGA